MADSFAKDPRFAHLSWDPKFSRVPRRERKVKIDDRFKSMFTDRRFQSKFSVDKRGRSVNRDTNDDLKRYYELSSEDEEKSEKNEEILDKKSKKDKLATKKESKKAKKLKKKRKNDKGAKVEKIKRVSDEESTGTLSESEEEDEPKISLDLARGEGNLQSSSDEEDSSGDEWTFEDDPDLPEHRWGELDADAPRTEQPTHRLSVCNMDWDRVKAKDLLVLFNSFKPQLGIIRSVTIYPSEFGKQRMKEEAINGPIELRQLLANSGKQKSRDRASFHNDSSGEDEKNHSDQSETETDENDQSESNDEDEATNHSEEDENDDDSANQNDEGDDLKILEREKVREYQLKRLKYFYAVVECDSPETANQIYEQCDGLEYESSATKLDLRFIPDEMAFDQETPHDQARELGDLDSYKPVHFRNAALQQAGKVELTWDETDPRRKQLIKRIFDAKNACGKDKKKKAAEDVLEELDEENLHRIIASGSSDEESDAAETVNDQKKMNLKSLVDSLLQKNGEQKSIDNDQKIDKDDFFIDNNAKSDEKVENLAKNEENRSKKSEKLTPWQQYLNKRREKRAQKRQEAKKRLEKSRNLNKPEQDFDDFPAGIDKNDPYFKEELRKFEKHSAADQSETTNVHSDADQSETSDANVADQSESWADDDDVIKQRQSLELLLSADSAAENRFRARNYNLKKLMNDASEKSKKSKKRTAAIGRETGLNETPTNQEQQDDSSFRLNLNDPRFSSLFESHLFNIDPTESAFKRTKNMQILLDEKIKRIKTDNNNVNDSEKVKGGGDNNVKITDNVKDTDKNISETVKNFDQKHKDSANLNLLIKSIKSKTKSMQMRKKDRTKSSMAKKC